MAETLVHRARKKGHLSEVALIFSVDKWCDIGDCMWESVINGGKEEKLLRPLDPLWRSVINSLKAMQAKRQAAAAAMQALAGTTTNLASEFDMPVRGITHPVCSSAGQIKALVGAAAPDLSNDTATESSAVVQQEKRTISDITPDGHCQEQPPAESESVGEGEGLEKLDCKVKILTKRLCNLEICMWQKKDTGPDRGSQLVPSTGPDLPTVPFAPPTQPAAPPN